jgi:hypothetical protein
MFTLCSATCTSNSIDCLSHWIIMWIFSQLSEWRRSSLHSISVSDMNHVPFFRGFLSGSYAERKTHIAAMIHISQVCKLENVSHSYNHQKICDAYADSMQFGWHGQWILNWKYFLSKAHNGCVAYLFSTI